MEIICDCAIEKSVEMQYNFIHVRSRRCIYLRPVLDLTVFRSKECRLTLVPTSLYEKNIINICIVHYAWHIFLEKGLRGNKVELL